LEEVITACHDAVTIMRETADRPGEGQALDNLGVMMRQVRRLDEAITSSAVAMWKNCSSRSFGSSPNRNIIRSLEK
jgi:hypothetical protein